MSIAAITKEKSRSKGFHIQKVANAAALTTPAVGDVAIGALTDGSLVLKNSDAETFTVNRENPDAVTATADGLTTGIVPADSTYITITSAGANNIATIPVPYAGKVLRGKVTTNGCELRGVAAAGTKINDVVVSGTNEAALPADTYFELLGVSATEYILTALTKLGAVVTAIVPDAV